MKVAVIVYHKNALANYPLQWIDRFRESIYGQSYKHFDIIENNYGNGALKIFSEHSMSALEGGYLWSNIPCNNFVVSMNMLLCDLFFKDNYDYVFNTNIDDHYAEKWIETLLKYGQQGYDLVSSNFALIRDDKQVMVHEFDKLDIQAELDKDHNIICHPAVMYSKRFWEANQYQAAEIPFEDMKLWQRALRIGLKFKIAPEVLCFHRLHDKSVGHNLKEQ